MESTHEATLLGLEALSGDPGFAVKTLCPRCRRGVRDGGGEGFESERLSCALVNTDVPLPFFRWGRDSWPWKYQQATLLVTKYPRPPVDL